MAFILHTFSYSRWQLKMNLFWYLACCVPLWASYLALLFRHFRCFWCHCFLAKHTANERAHTILARTRSVGSSTVFFLFGFSSLLHQRRIKALFTAWNHVGINYVFKGGLIFYDNEMFLKWLRYSCQRIYSVVQRNKILSTLLHWNDLVS